MGNHAAYRWSAEPGWGKGQGAECLPAGRAFRSYGPGVSDQKIRVTVTLEITDPDEAPGGPWPGGVRRPK